MGAEVKKIGIGQAPFPHHHLLGIEHLSPDNIEMILSLADRYVTQNRHSPRKSDRLKGSQIVNLFFEPSTRTRLSFEMAGKRLGADVINFGAEGSSLQKGESFIDTLLTINAMRPDFVVIRSKEIDSAKTASTIFDCPVLNAGDGANEHPTQALLDALALKRHFKTLAGLKIVITGDIKHSRVARSNALLLTKMGAHVVFCAPTELLPDNCICPTKTNWQEAFQNADAIMTLRLQKERFETDLSFDMNDYFENYGLTADKLAIAKKECVVLHPGPMNHGIEIAADMADHTEKSLILKQVECGVAVRMACLDLLATAF